MLNLIIGDLHIPNKAHEIAKAIRDQLVPGKIHQILCTGNVCVKSELDYLRSVCNQIVCVRGEYDEDGISNIEETTLTIGGFKVGLVSGFGIFPSDDPARYAEKARELDVDILIHGGTHHLSAYEHDGRFFLDPGSASGAFTATDPNPVPSFMLLSVQSNTAIVFLYTVNEDGTLESRKERFVKKDD